MAYEFRYITKENKVFISYGSYKGAYFEEAYFDIDFTNLSQTEEDAKKLMEISPILDPVDGIIQSFILAKKDDQGFVFYLFVDEDWKSSVEFTNIIYGRDFNIDSTLKQRAYVFEEIKSGVYMDKIDDYNNWYEKKPVTGGIMLGEMTLQDLEKDEVVM